MTKLNGHLLPPHYFFMDGYITFISSHSALPNWACDLSNKKQNSVIDNLKNNHHTILGKTYNFVDDHSATSEIHLFSTVVAPQTAFAG